MRTLPLALWVLGCTGQETPVVRLDVPIDADDRALVLGLELGERLRVSAHAISEARSIAPVLESFDLGEPLRATAYLYDDNLATLSIAEGLLEEASSGRPIPVADRTVAAEIVEGTASAWSDVAASPALEAFRFRATEPACAELGLTTIAIDGRGPPTFALGFDEGVLFALEDGQLLFVDRSLDITVLSANHVFFSAFRDQEELRLGGQRGQVWSGELDLSVPAIRLSVTATVPHGDDVLFLDGGGGELFAQTRSQWIEHFDGTTWRSLAQITDRGRSTGLVRLGPNRAISIFGDCPCIFEHEGDRTTEVAVPANTISSNGISSLIHHPSYGTVAGSFIGELLESRIGESGWTKLEGAYSTLEVSSIAIDDAGFFYSDKRSVLVQYLPGVGYCEIHAPSQMLEGTSEVARSGDDLAVIGGSPETLFLFWWTRLPKSN